MPRSAPIVPLRKIPKINLETSVSDSEVNEPGSQSDNEQSTDRRKSVAFSEAPTSLSTSPATSYSNVSDRSSSEGQITALTVTDRRGSDGRNTMVRSQLSISTSFLEIHRERPVDFVIVYRFQDIDQQADRKLFEIAMRNDGLQFSKEMIGELVFVKIHTPFERLCLEADRVKLEMPLKGRIVIREPSRSCLGKMKESLVNFLKTEDEFDLISAPFEVERLNLFEGADKPASFFRTSQRGYLTYHILINLSIHGNHLEDVEVGEVSTSYLRHDNITQKKGLLYLYMEKAYIDYFVLHEESKQDPFYTRVIKTAKEEDFQDYPLISEDPRSKLNKTWVKMYKFQPMWQIRNYFGEKIAFYFAWQGELVSYLWIPAIAGLVIYTYGFIQCSEHVNADGARFSCIVKGETQSDFKHKNLPECYSITHFKNMGTHVLDIFNQASDTVYTSVFSIVICIWGMLFMKMWSRKQNTLAYEWDVDTFDNAEPDRPEFFGTKTTVDPLTTELMTEYPQARRTLKIALSSLVVIGMMAVVFASVCGVLIFKVHVRHHFDCPNHDDHSLINTTTRFTTTTVEPSANMDLMGLAEPESFPETAHVDSKGYSFKGYTNYTGPHPLLCEALTVYMPAIMNAVSLLLLYYIYYSLAVRLTDWENHRTQTDYDNYLIAKLFAFQFANSYTSLFYLAFFRHVDNGFQDNGLFGMGPDYKDTCDQGTCMPMLSFQVLVFMLTKPFAKFYWDIIWPNIRKAFLALKTMLCGQFRVRSSTAEIDPVGIDVVQRSKSYIFSEYRKPDTGDFTLEEYNEKIITFGYLVMFSAAIPLAPALMLFFNILDNLVDVKRLLWFNRRPISMISSHIGMWFHILRFIVFCGIISNAFIIAFTSSFVQREFQSTKPVYRLMVVIVFEHVVAVLMYFIHVFTPDKKGDVVLSMRKEKYHVRKILETGDTKEAELRKRWHQMVTAAKTSSRLSGVSPGMIRRAVAKAPKKGGKSKRWR